MSRLLKNLSAANGKDREDLLATIQRLERDLAAAKALLVALDAAADSPGTQPSKRLRRDALFVKDRDVDAVLQALDELGGEATFAAIWRAVESSGIKNYRAKATLGVLLQRGEVEKLGTTFDAKYRLRKR